MPHKDPAVRNAYQRARYPARRERLIAERRAKMADPAFAEKTRQYFLDYRQKHIEKIRAYDRERSHREDRHDVLRKLKFGLTRAQYDEMLHAQSGVCAICREPERTVVQGRVKALAVDHDHQTGRIRALLCNNCNRAIGLLKDSVDTLVAAAAYLERHKTMSNRIGNSGPFPEKQQTQHKPSNAEKSHFTKKSDHVGRGHTENPQRMQHPQQAENPMDESGEGQDGIGNSMGSGLEPEQA